MRICLAALHANPHFTPLALLYLKAYLVETEGRAADDITILEFTEGPTPDEVARGILATAPDIVALSCYVWNITTFMAACRLIKAQQPEALIVLGGPEVGPVAEAVLTVHRSADIIVKSEGETPFAEIVRAVEAGTPLDAVKGICFRRGSHIADTGEAPILMDLNTLPSPHQPAYANYDRRIVCIETQRGCVFRCTFCFYNKDFSIRNRRFDLDRVTREIRRWIDHDVREIYLMDPIFNLKADRAKAICRFIIAHNHRRVKIHAEVWAEFIDDELARLMREANFQDLEVGLQTTDETALAAVERRLRMGAFLDGIGHLKRHHLRFELQLIFGLPGETLASFRRSLNFAAALDPPSLSVFPLMVLPGTELWRKAQALDLRFDPEPPYYVRSHRDMSAGDIAHGEKIIRALDLLGDSKTVRVLCREPGVTMSAIVDAWVAWMDAGARPAHAGQRARQFVAHFCEAQRIPPEFYNGFASIEFSD